jgi:hypothetical protein
MKASACALKNPPLHPLERNFSAIIRPHNGKIKKERDRRSDMNKEIRRVKWGIISALGTPHVCLNTFASSF